jgi:hypothetical protein
MSERSARERQPHGHSLPVTCAVCRGIMCPDCGTFANVCEKCADTLEECGCCGCYHRPGFTGDCREDANRF